MASKIIDKNKINKESENNRIANDKGVGSTNLLGNDKSNNSGYKDYQMSRCVSTKFILSFCILVNQLNRYDDLRFCPLIHWFIRY